MHLRVHRHPPSGMDSVCAWFSGSTCLFRSRQWAQPGGAWAAVAEEACLWQPRLTFNLRRGPALPAGSVELAGYLRGCYLGHDLFN